MITNDLYDLLIQLVLLLRLLLRQTIGFLKPVEHLVMKVNFLSPHRNVIILPWRLVACLVFVLSLPLHH